MKILRVGDPHITVRNIPEAEKLMDFVFDIAWKEQVDRVEFMGDLFHTHAVIRVEVLDFWKRTFKKFTERNIQVLALVGNHDQPGSREKEQEMNALKVFQEEPMEVGKLPNPLIVDQPMRIGGIGYIPYVSDENTFVKAANGFDEEIKCLIAHQTFTGAQYENGFYAPDGIDPARINVEGIVSGHIHKSQQVGNCFYTGTPKWDGMSDANEDKGVWIFEHAQDGSILSKEFYSTKEVVTPIYKHVIVEGEAEPELVKNARNYVELHGKSAWIKKMKNKYKGMAQIKAKPIDRKMVRLNQKEFGDIYDFLKKSFNPIDGISKDKINKYLKEVVQI